VAEYAARSIVNLSEEKTETVAPQGAAGGWELCRSGIHFYFDKERQK
jgi:hypothetical protein